MANENFFEESEYLRKILINNEIFDGGNLKVFFNSWSDTFNIPNNETFPEHGDPDNGGNGKVNNLI